MAARFVTFTGLDVQRFFAGQSGFSQLDHKALGASEWIFGRRVFLPAATDLLLSLRVYTTVYGDVNRPYTAVSRDKGEDAIRVILFWGEVMVDSGSMAEVLVPRFVSHVDVKRTQGWREGIAAAVTRWEDLLGPPCPLCGKPTGRREGPKGTFYSCVDWKEKGCKGTHQSKACMDLPPCPACDGTLVVRKGSRGEFLGCSNYPRCKHCEGLREAA